MELCPRVLLTICLPSAKIAVMGPEPAVNAVYANKIAAIEDESERELFVKEKRREYEQDVDLLRLAADLIVDSVVQPGELRNELIRRMQAAGQKERFFSERRHGVPPV